MTAISGERMARDIEVIAGFNETTPEVGYSRPTFTAVWRQARDYVQAEAQAAGCQVRIDAAGNLHARPRTISSDRPVWVSGSHLDSVPTGGKFDGVAGVVAALEVLRAYPGAPLELIAFAEEEGTTFNLGMLGSRAWAGTLDAAALGALRNRDGESPLAAGAPHGLDAVRLADDRLDSNRYLGLIELHVEQGPALWKAGLALALVTAINGRRQYAVRVTGSPNHAGSTKMADRADALAGAAEMVTALEALARELDTSEDHTVITVGQLSVHPNAINVVPGEVRFTIDFRARNNAMLARGDGRLGAVVSGVAARRGVTAVLTQTEALPAVPLDAGLCRRIQAAAGRLGLGALPEAASGALHDAAILAPLLPTVMLFIASRDGISHNPAEFSRIEDLVTATRVLAACVTDGAA